MVQTLPSFPTRSSRSRFGIVLCLGCLDSRRELRVCGVESIFNGGLNALKCWEKCYRKKSSPVFFLRDCSVQFHTFFRFIGEVMF